MQLDDSIRHEKAYREFPLYTDKTEYASAESTVRGDRVLMTWASYELLLICLFWTFSDLIQDRAVHLHLTQA